MINASQSFIDALSSDNRRFLAELRVDGVALDCAIVSLEIVKGSCGNEESFAIGDVFGSTLTAVVKGLSVNVKGKTIEVKIGVLTDENNETYEYITLGNFVVSEAPQTAYRTTITAYGKTITRTGDAFVVPQIKTLSNIAQSIASSVSAVDGSAVTVTFDSGISTSGVITASMEGLTVYQALQVLAGVVGGYVIDTPDGNIKICRYSSQASGSYDTSRMINLPEADEENFQVRGVLCIVTPESVDDEGEVIPAVQYPANPTGEENLVLQNEYVTEQLYNAHLSTLVGYSYRPATVVLTLGDPRIEGNDVLDIIDISRRYIVPCHRVRHIYTGGFKTEIVAVKGTEISQEVATSGPVTEQLSSITANVISARASAETAKQYADEAKRTTDEINAYAETVEKTVTQILADGETAGEKAQEAIESASIAYGSAQSAIFQLGMVEDVLGTAEWIYSHSIYVACTEAVVIEGKIYFTLTGTAIANPTGNPREQAYYELVGGKYVLSEDTEVDSQKTYYQVTPSQVAEPSGDPSTIPYYERRINEAVVQYINTHLALSDKGLSITDGSRSSILISSEEGEEGVIFYGPTGIVAKYGRDAIIGNTRGYHIEITTSDETQQGRLSFKNVDTEIAYMTNDELYIPRVVVVNSMQIGNWIWDAVSSGNHLTLKWRG